MHLLPAKPNLTKSAPSLTEHLSQDKKHKSEAYIPIVLESALDISTMETASVQKKIELLNEYQSASEIRKGSHVNIMSKDTTNGLRSPREYVRILNAGLIENELSELHNLEIVLRSMVNVEEFIAEAGLTTMLKNFKFMGIKASRHLSPEQKKVQIQYIRCFATIMNNSVGLKALLETQDGIAILALGLSTDSILVKAKLLELFGAICYIPPNGHSLILEALEYYRRVRSETSRFRDIINDLRLDELDHQVTGSNEF